jgi:hypothetical protein
LDVYLPSGFPTQSALSLTLGSEVSSISCSPSPFRPASPDVCIGIEGSSSAHHEGLAAIFSTHRFILVSRSDYFHNALIAWNTQKPEIRDDDQDDDRSVEPPTLMLSSPPSIPPSLHFVLGFIYTGTLIFSNRTYDLDTAFHIMRSAMLGDIMT